MNVFKESCNVESFELNCEQNHLDNLVGTIVSSYCNIRIFHVVKMFNQNLSKGKKGAELNKNKKFNM